VRLDPGQFTTRIDNRWWPMTPGSRWTYRETDGQGSTQRVQVTVTGQTRTISGVQARVVHDVVTEDGQLVQNTYDWYAQDDKGNVWYLGEDTKEYEGGKVVSTEGSWEAGVDGAQPGILLPADPRRDMAYRQEYHKGQAEDAARVLSLDMRAEVPAGSFDQLLTTQDSTPLEPKLLEQVLRARVGPVLAITVRAAPAGRSWSTSSPPPERPFACSATAGSPPLQVGSPVWGEADGPTGMPTLASVEHSLRGQEGTDGDGR
jgi:hypothetical protein